MLHTITVVHDPDSDDVTLTINHPDKCPHTWWECLPCPDPPPDDEDVYWWYDDQERHGVEHSVFGGSPCIESNDCYLNAIFNWHYPDDVPDQDGTYLLDFEGGDLDDSYLLIGSKKEE